MIFIHTEISWIFQNCTPTTQEKRDLFGIMVEIGIRVLFTNFCYTFGGKIFLQQVGGPSYGCNYGCKQAEDA